MKNLFLSLTLLTLASSSGAFAGTLYSNTSTDTGLSIVYSTGPYEWIGDQIRLSAAGTADTARLQFFNLGDAGTFDALLRFYEVGEPVGEPIGSTYTVTGLNSGGGDIIDVSFSLAGLALPQDVIFLVSLANFTEGMDLGLNLFEPPTVGSSDNTFFVASTDGVKWKELSDGWNVYFELTERGPSAVPEPSTFGLMGIGLAAAWAGVRRRTSRS